MKIDWIQIQWTFKFGGVILPGLDLRYLFLNLSFQRFWYQNLILGAAGVFIDPVILRGLLSLSAYLENIANLG